MNRINLECAICKYYPIKFCNLIHSTGLCQECIISFMCFLENYYPGEYYSVMGSLRKKNKPRKKSNYLRGYKIKEIKNIRKNKNIY